MAPSRPIPVRPPLAIRLLGPTEVWVAGGPLPPLYSRKGGWLLALLTLHHDHPLERGWLAGTLWPEAVDHQALYYLRRELWHLRKGLGEEAARLVAPTPHTLRLELAGAEVDLLAFRCALDAGDPRSLEEAVRLYRGPLLTGCPEEWAAAEREKLEQAYLSALGALAKRALAAGDPDGACGYLRLIILSEPLRESAHAALMRAQAARGDYAGSLQTYRDLRRALREELNTEPSAETAALFRRLCREARDPPRRAPAAIPLQAVPDLPCPLTGLIGRDEEIQEISACLAGARLVTLTGAGGVGKTRLALEVARRLAERYAHGARMVELGSLADPALAPAAIGAALEVPDQPGRPVVERLVEMLRPRELLLLLDNCEHLVQPVAELAGRLLRECPRLRILATSRQSLGLTGEAAWRVPSLRAPDETELPRQEKDAPERLLDYSAVRLFVERARQADPQFRLTRQNAAAVAEVCRRLDGIPLALELAAARAAVITPAQMVERLGEPFRLLCGGSRAALERHQTLLAAMKWSFDLLGETERAFLARLSVFAGGWTLEAAEAVCTGGAVEAADVLDVISGLVDRSLVVATTGHGEARYRLLETVRAFAAAQLQGDERASVERRHAAYFLSLAERAEPELYRASQDEWMRHLDREHGNMRAALRWSLGAARSGAPTGEDGGALGLRLAGSLERFWWQRGHGREGRGWLEKALTADQAAEGNACPDPARLGARAKALQACAAIAWVQGDYAAAERYVEEGSRAYESLGDGRGLASMLLHRGGVNWVQGECATAQRCFEVSRATFREVGDLWGLAAVTHCMADTCSYSGDVPRAGELYRESEAYLQELGDRWLLAGALLGQGILAGREGDGAGAGRFFGEALAIAWDLRDFIIASQALEGLAILGGLRAAGPAETREAVRLLGAGEALRDSVGLPLLPLYEAEHAQSVAAARALLGDHAFESAWNEGRAAPLAEVVVPLLPPGRTG